MSVTSPPAQQPLAPVYVAARRVLLDALVQLAPHGPAVIVAGAQAVYLRTGTADLAIAPYTTDGDLAIDPARLGATPLLAQAMAAAGFSRSLEPGTWHAPARVEGDDVGIPVDLIVPEQAAPTGGRRGARLGSHGDRTARRASGLEAALVDRSPMTIAALDPADSRTVEAQVAGEPALLVAKLFKVNDRARSAKAHRLDDKDAADVVRLMRTTRPAAVGARLAELRPHPLAGDVCAEAVELLQLLFGRAGRPGVRMATRALRQAMAESLVEGLCVAYGRELARAFEAAQAPA
jgi:hypothetical protein